jgi:hypothetical protein
MLVPTSESHADFGSSLFALGKESRVYLRVLVLILDLRPPGLDVLIGFGQILDLVRESPGFEREIARRLYAGIEMLMKPVGRRLEQTARPPVDPYARLSLLPEIRIALA